MRKGSVICTRFVPFIFVIIIYMFHFMSLIIVAIVVSRFISIILWYCFKWSTDFFLIKNLSHSKKKISYISWDHVSVIIFCCPSQTCPLHTGRRLFWVSWLLNKISFESLDNIRNETKYTYRICNLAIKGPEYFKLPEQVSWGLNRLQWFYEIFFNFRSMEVVWLSGLTWLYISHACWHHLLSRAVTNLDLNM